MSNKNVYKQTILGKSPTEWETTDLEQVIQLKALRPTIDPQQYKEEEFELYSIPAYHEKKKPELKKGSEIGSQKIIVKNDTILFGKLNPRIPKIWYVSSTSSHRKIASTEFISLLANSRTVPKYIYYLVGMESVLNRARSLTKGSTPSRKRVDINAFLRVKIPLPPLSEQQKITSILSTVDECIQWTDEVISKTEELKRGLMQKLLTKGIGHTRFKQTEIGEIPEEWRIEKLENIITEFKSGFASGARDDNGIVQLRMNNISIDGRIVLNSYLKVPRPKNLSEYLLKDGDVLFNNTNSVDLIGKSAIFREEMMPCTYSNHLTRLRVNTKRTIPDWVLYYFIKRWHRRYFFSICNRHVGQAGITANDIKHTRIPIAPLDEQRKITSILSTVDKKIRDKEREKGRLEELKRGMMQILLTGKVRVKLC